MKTFLSSLFVFVFIIGTWFAGNFFLFGTERHTYRELVAQLEDKNCLKNELLQVEKQKKYKIKYAKIIRTEQEFLEKRIPKTAELAAMLVTLQQLAEDSNLSLHEFQVGKSHSLGVWSEIPVRVTISGDFLPFSSFLDKINNQERLIVVHNLKYGDAQAELELLIYFGNWPFHEERRERFDVNQHHCGDDLISTKMDSIVTRLPNKNLVHSWSKNPFILPENIPSLSHIHLTGVVCLEDNTWMALLENDQGIGTIVQVGSPVVDGFVVQEITAELISLIKDGQVRQLKWSN